MTSSDPSGPGPPPRPRRFRDEEPFATIRAHPWRFAIGFPLVFALSIGASLPFVFRSLALAIALQLGLQTAGLIWLYVPVALRRWREADEVRAAGDGIEGAGPRD